MTWPPRSRCRQTALTLHCPTPDESAHFRPRQRKLPARVARSRVFSKKHTDQRALDGESVLSRPCHGGLVQIGDVPVKSLAAMARDERFHQAKAGVAEFATTGPR